MKPMASFLRTIPTFSIVDMDVFVVKMGFQFYGRLFPERRHPGWKISSFWKNMKLFFTLFSYETKGFEEILPPSLGGGRLSNNKK